MAIVKMSKFTLLSFESHKEELLKKLHLFGNVEFENLNDSKEELPFLKSMAALDEVSNYEGEVAKANYCIQKLKPFVPKVSMIAGLKEGKKTLSFKELENKVLSFNHNEVYTSLKKLDGELNDINNQRGKIESEIDAIIPYRNIEISIKDVEDFKLVKTFIGFVPLTLKSEALEKLNSSFDSISVEVLSEDKDNVYLVIAVENNNADECEDILRTFNFNKATLNYQSTISEKITSLRNSLDSLNEREGKVKEEIVKLAIHFEKLEEVHEYYSDLVIKSRANENFLKSDNVVVINGWVPTELIGKLEKIVKECTNDNYYIETVEAEKDDTEVPIKLKNNKFVSAFEDITSMYALPMYNEIDPTPLLSIFYAIFFGMMVADFGYGFVMLIGTAIALKVFNLEDGTKNFIKFLFYLSFPTIIFGFIYGAGFGDAIKTPALIDPNTDYNKILVLSLGLGVLQIFVGLSMKAITLIKNGKPLDAFYDSGSWIITLVGLGLWVASVPGGMWVAIIGMVLIVLTQGRQAPSIGGKLGAGAYALYGITGYVSDLVSYTRLMALGLSGGSIAGAINVILSGLTGNIFGLIIAIILFIGLQIFNLGLGALGAYVHSIRLQYVEYFGKFYEGGGREFKPFTTKNEYINVKND